MKAYLLTAAGVIFLSVVVSLLVPEGKLHKSITFIMRLVCILVLLQPITGLFKISETATNVQLFDTEYVCGVYSEHQSKQLEELLYKEFDTQADCAVTVTYSGGEFKVDEVSVELQKNNAQLIEEIYAYLDELKYINITVYAKST